MCRRRRCGEHCARWTRFVGRRAGRPCRLPCLGGNMRFLRFLTSALALMSSVLAARGPAQTSYPMITNVTPVAVQRGKTAEVIVEGKMNFAGVYKALFEGSGISA